MSPVRGTWMTWMWSASRWPLAALSHAPIVAIPKSAARAAAVAVVVEVVVVRLAVIRVTVGVTARLGVTG